MQAAASKPLVQVVQNEGRQKMVALCELRVSFENWAHDASPLLYPPHRGEERIKAFPDGERLDRGEARSPMRPFSSSVGERKIMNHSAVNISSQ
jgi:hypothetical protein